jgi:hypothetical protein
MERKYKKSPDRFPGQGQPHGLVTATLSSSAQPNERWW